MKKFLFFMMVALVIAGCSGGEELVVDTQIWFLAKAGQDGDKSITGEFFLFEKGDYDPTTFEYKYNATSVWESGIIKTKDGKIARSFYTNIVLENSSESYFYKCRPGNYYVVSSIGKDKNMAWKAKNIIVEENKINRVEAIYISGGTGYREWDE